MRVAARHGGRFLIFNTCDGVADYMRVAARHGGRFNTCDGVADYMRVAARQGGRSDFFAVRGKKFDRPPCVSHRFR